MGEIEDEIESKAEEAKEASDDQHLGDAMDDADPQDEDDADGASTR